MEIHLMLAKIRGTMAALDKMTAKEREAAPSGTYGRDYNKLRDEVEKAYPNLKEALPPRVEVFEPVMGAEMVRARYVEIHSYYAQLHELLKHV
jgi:hypothetical protein